MNPRPRKKVPIPVNSYVLRIPRETHFCDPCNKTQTFVYVDGGLECTVCGRIKVWRPDSK